MWLGAGPLPLGTCSHGLWCAQPCSYVDTMHISLDKCGMQRLTRATRTCPCCAAQGGTLRPCARFRSCSDQTWKLRRLCGTRLAAWRKRAKKQSRRNGSIGRKRRTLGCASRSSPPPRTCVVTGEPRFWHRMFSERQQCPSPCSLERLVEWRDASG